MSNDSLRIQNKIIELTAIEKFSGSTKESEELFRKYFSRIKLKFSKVKVITITGTNGKGQTAFVLERLLKKNNHNVAKWSSPHIQSISERITYNCAHISYTSMERLITDKSVVANEFGLSFYEFLFLIFCEYLLEQKTLDFIVLEVGMGGRLDTCNFFEPDITAITSIGLDHTEFLGDSLKEILMEKVAITRAGVPHFSTISLAYLQNLEEKYCQDHGVIRECIFDRKLNYIQSNNLLAKTLFQYLVPGVAINNEELNSIPLGPARMQAVPLGESSLTLNGSHNVDGVKALTKFLYEQNIKNDYLVLALGNRSRTEIEQMIKILKSYPCRFKNIVMTSFDHPRAMPRSEAEEIAKIFMIPFVNYGDFFATILAEKKKLKVFVTGSNYFISEVLSGL